MRSIASEVMLRRVLKKIKKELLLLNNLTKNYKITKYYAHLSVLSKSLIDSQYTINFCPICKSDDIHVFARFPLNVPNDQNHSLLYFDYSKIDIELLKGNKEMLDKTLGFFLSVVWKFCRNCKNGSLATQFSEEHLLRYYKEYYTRVKKTDILRCNTKELHGRYLSTLLHKNSSVLEIGAAEGIAAEYLALKGYNVYVYEPSRYFSRQLERSSLIKYTDDLTALAGSLDAIYLHHVLEHIPDPVNYIKSLRQVLKNEGLLFIQVPDLSLQINMLSKIIKKSIYSIFNRPYFDFEVIQNKTSKKNNSDDWFDSLANDHITAFTPEGIEYVIKEGGYKLTGLIQSDKNRITFDNEKYAWPIDEETGSPPNGLTLTARKT